MYVLRQLILPRTLTRCSQCCFVADFNILMDPLDLESGSEDSSPGTRLPNAFLSKLTEHAKELERQFETIRKQLFDHAREGEASLLRWSARAQLAKYAEEGNLAKTVL